MPQKPGARLRAALAIKRSQAVPPRQEIPPEIFRALFLEEDEARAKRELCRIRRAIRKDPLAVVTWGLTPWRPRGRPKGARSRSLEQEALPITMAVDWYGLNRTEALRTLKRDPTFVPAPQDFHWLRERVEVARKVLADMLARDPSLATVRASICALPPHNRKTHGRALLKALRLR